MSDEKKNNETGGDRKKNRMIESDAGDSSICFLTFEAYKQIVLHATRFANIKIPMNAWKEVYGFLVGTIENNKVLVDIAVPMAHGSSVEVEFSEDHYVKSVQIDSWAAKRNMFIVGWYHSHPGLGLFLSSTDIINQLGYQGPNPSAVALVFDHTKIKEPGHPGFAVFKLNNPDLGPQSDFHAIHWEIEKVNRAKYIKSLYEFSERNILKQPLVLEYGEDVSTLGSTSREPGSINISTTPLENIEIILPSLNVDSIMKGMLNGFQRFIKEIIPPMLLALNDQNRATATTFQNLVNKQVKILDELKESLSIGVGELRKQFITKIDDSHEGLSNIMTTNFIDQMGVLTKTSDDVSNIENRIIDDVVQTRKEIMKTLGIKFPELTDIVTEKINLMKDTLDNISNMEDRIIDDVVQTRKEIMKNLDVKFPELTDIVTEKINLMKDILDNVSNMEDRIIGDVIKAREEIMKNLDVKFPELTDIVTEKINLMKDTLDNVSNMEDRIIGDVIKAREEIMKNLDVKFPELTDIVIDNINSIKNVLDVVQKNLGNQFKLSTEATHDKLSDVINLLKTHVFERLSELKETLKIQPITAPDSLNITQELKDINKKIDNLKITHNQILEKILIKIKAFETIMKSE
ncbi:MAG: Mov34/MPN/PAD-1 family protein [Promethearchaeota archaeon]